MSSSRASCCLSSEKKQKHMQDCMYNISILRFGCCNIQHIQGFGKGYHSKPTPISTLIILDISKTELIIVYNYITCIPTNLHSGIKLTTTT